MQPPSKNVQKLLDNFAACSADERALIQLLSIIYAPVSKQVLFNCAKNLSLPGPMGRGYTLLLISETLEKLKKAKLVESSGQGTVCNPNLTHLATLSSVRDGRFAAMARVVQLDIPMVSNWGSSFYRLADHALRDVRISFYQKDANSAFEMAVRYRRQFPYEALRLPPFLAVCSNPYDEAWFRSLPEALQIASLQEMLPFASRNLIVSDEPFQVALELAAKPGAPEILIDLCCMELLVRGKSAEAETVARRGSSTTQLAILGCCALQRGAVSESIAHFQGALLKLKKETGKRKTFFADLTGPFFVLALTASGDPKLLEEAEGHCRFVTARREWPDQEVYHVLELVISERKGERGSKEEIERSLFRAPDPPLYALFRFMAAYWCDLDREKLAAEAFRLQVLTKTMRRAGYHWLADEIELTSFACGEKTPEAGAAKERYRAQGLKPFYQCIEKVESWKSALSALINLNSKKEQAPEKPAAQSRLIWLFEERRDYFEVTPREQKQSATGKWSAGRNVSLKRLAEEADGIDFLSEQDRLICGCIKQERGYGYYGRDGHRLDQDQAVPLMIGHPHVYLDPAASVRLELVRGEPEIQLVTEGETLELRIDPPFGAEQKVLVLKESPTRMKVYQAKEEYRKITAIVGGGLKLPAQAKEQALAAINTLSSILTVHSDIGDESAELIAGDATPCFHLLPYQAGLKLELLVRPFSDAGPYFRPGAGGETVMAELEGKRVQSKRDLRLEARRAADAVAALSILQESEDGDGAWLVPATESALELLLQLQSLGDAVRVAWPEGAKFKIRQIATTRECRVVIRQAKDWFELEGEIKLNQGLALDLQQLVQLAKDSPGRFVQLGDGEFLALSAQLRKHLDELASCTEPHGKALRFHPLVAGMFEDFAAEAGEFVGDAQWRKQLKRLREAEAFVPQLPTTLQAELRSYQEEGFNWLNRLARWGVGACLADDMGLGKTVQALAQMLTMATDGPSLVVAPTSVCANWESESAKFAPTLNTIVFGGQNRAERMKGLKPFDLVICSYGLLQQEEELLASVDWQAIVLDEAQAIKNMATKRSQAAMRLNAAFKMVATGTPIENHLGELWNVFRFINPGLLGSLKQFNVKFAAPIEKTRDKKARGSLKKLIQPFILRRTKNQVLEELPPRTEITMKVEMSEEEASLYEAIRQSALENLAGVGKVEGKGEQHLKILAEIMRLRRACCNPRLILPDTPIPSTKLAAFGEIVAELRENRHKALVFSQFVGHLELIRQYVAKEGIPYQYLDGSPPVPERKKRVDAFQAGVGDLFLISLKAGGVGLNLTAADYVIHMDPWWNPAVEDQASDRAHRIGQLRPVTIYRLVTKGTIEEKIVGLHQQKRGLADSLLEESDLSGKISAQELLTLLRKES